MSRSFIYLRRALFGTSCAVVFGFGASQALATPYPSHGSGMRSDQPQRLCDVRRLVLAQLWDGRILFRGH